MSEPNRKDYIMANVDQFVIDFLYYDRSEDEDLPLDAIEEAIKAGETSVDEIAERFRSELEKAVARFNAEAKR